MKTKFIKFCKRCNTQTEHYACGNCIKCMLAYKKIYEQLHKETRRTYHNTYQMSDLNNSNTPKQYIRHKSRYILFTKRKHTKLENYEIHHCFGYNDPNKFIYIPKDLHLMIHQRLRDLNISADNNHYNDIVDLINECQEYTYISI